MSRNRDSLKHQIRVKVLDGITDNDSKKAYRRSADSFAEWAKGQNIKDLSQVSKDVIQAYERYLEERPEGYSPSTIHAKLTAPCKAAGVNMSEIQKPKRTAGQIKRGRSETKTKQGEKELDNPKYERLVSLQKCVGIRRAELGKLTGEDLISDGKQLYIMVHRGKGGKDQLQWILPEDRETVLRIFENVGDHERVFSGEEMGNHINLHKMRSDCAKKAYAYYADNLKKPELRDRMRQALLRRWEDGHRQLLAENPKHYEASRRKFIQDMNDRPILLRGENRAKAVSLGLPVLYDRLCVMCVSVYHLSHWRNDVSIINYLTQ